MHISERKSIFQNSNQVHKPLLKPKPQSQSLHKYKTNISQKSFDELVHSVFPLLKKHPKLGHVVCPIYQYPIKLNKIIGKKQISKTHANVHWQIPVQ